jgi:nanoRNase/pAp phosphatase (c-di-AMP/oligoRNAs hydrolase)
VREGAAILRREQQIIKDHVAAAYEAELAGHHILACNATTLFSDIAGEMAKGRPFGLCWFDRADGKRQYSLRSDEQGVDVSEVAKQFGGGGHKHAAGFALGMRHGIDVDPVRRVAP